MIDDRLLDEHNTSEFWRSVRDLVWYAGQVCVMWLAWTDRQRPIYVVLGVAALLIAISTAGAAVKWRREIRRHRAALGAEPSGGGKARLRHAK
jgi:hypothetical protein